MTDFRAGATWSESGTTEAPARSLVYREVKLDCGCLLNLLAEEVVIVVVNAVDLLAPIHQAQLLYYLRLSGLKVGLLINFNVKFPKKWKLTLYFSKSSYRVIKPIHRFRICKS